MAIATSTAVALALAAASAGTQYVNTRNTANRTDRALADQIRNQGKKQQELDGKVNEQVGELANSRSDQHRAESLDSYMETLRRGKPQTDQGLTPNVGGEAFRADSAKAMEGVQQEAAGRAGVMSRIDAPTMQRQDEGFGYGRLATDISMLAREAAGQDYLDQLRVRRASERSPWLDALSSMLGGAAGAGIGGGGGGGGFASKPGGFKNPVGG